MKGHPAEGSLGNPIDRSFPHPIPKTREQDFYDRARALAIAMAVLSQAIRKPLLVRGERCVGKTSLLNRIRRWLETWAQRDRFRAISIEPGSLTSWQEFAQEIWDGVLGCIEAAGVELPAQLRAPREFRTFGLYCAELRRLVAYLPGVTFVIFLDELDKIGECGAGLPQTKILSLIRHLVESEELPLAFVIAVLRKIPGQEGLGSPLAVEEITLQPFDAEEAREMVTALLDDGLRLTPAAAEWLYRLTGGHPYFVKLLLAMAWDCFGGDAPHGSLTAEELQQAVNAASAARRKQLNDVLQDVYDRYLNDSEREILLWLALKTNGHLTGEELRTALPRLKTAAEELVGCSYLARAADDGYQLRLGWWRDWLRGWPEYRSEVERLRGAAPAPQASASQPGILVDRATQRVWVEGEPVTNLPDLEYRALVCLVERVNQVVSKDDLAACVYPDEQGVSDEMLSSLIYRLRLSIKDQKRENKYIETVRSRGFRICNASFASPLQTQE